MDPDWHIRKAVAADAVELQQCMQAAYLAYRERMGGERLPPMEADYTVEIRDFPSWVVASKHRIIGGLIMVFETGQASIANIAVDPGFQGQGIGGALMRFAEAKAREKRLSKLVLATHLLLHENIALYLHLGWQESGRQGHKVFMEKHIQLQEL
jgi:GNAT superfamily N-acetyltransferase